MSGLVQIADYAWSSKCMPHRVGARISHMNPDTPRDREWRNLHAVEERRGNGIGAGEKTHTYVDADSEHQVTETDERL